MRPTRYREAIEGSAAAILKGLWGKLFGKIPSTEGS